MDEAALLLGLETLRSDPAYHSAETLRRKTPGGSAAMAAAKQGSAEHSAVTLLISRWDVIAALLRDAKSKDKIFEVTPVCHMYEELEPAIIVLKKDAPTFGAGFTDLHDEYQAWLKKKKKDAKYVSAACGGMLYARFG